MAYEVFLADLDEILAGHPVPETPVKISITRSWFGASFPDSIVGGHEGSRLDAAVFDRAAAPGDRALLVVGLHRHTEIDDLQRGTNAIAVGVLEIGRAVAFRIDGELYLPGAPADRPVFRVPKL